MKRHLKTVNLALCCAILVAASLFAALPRGCATATACKCPIAAELRRRRNSDRQHPPHRQHPRRTARPEAAAERDRIRTIELFKVPPRWLFLKITTDSGLVGWGEPVVEGRADTVRAAVIELKNALQRDPDNAEARLLLGEVYVLVGDGAAAEKELGVAERLGIEKAKFVVALGRALLLQGRFEPLTLLRSR